MALTDPPYRSNRLPAYSCFTLLTLRVSGCCVVYPVGEEVFSLVAPVVGYHGIEVHPIRKFEEKFLSILSFLPMSKFVISLFVSDWPSL